MSRPLQNKIDFEILASVTKANPNGDPLAGNRPRTDFEGYGEISAECIKRKLRNRMQDTGAKIFVQSEDRCDDGFASLADRAKATMTNSESRGEYAARACQEWLDVRSFGQVFAFSKKDDEGSVSVSVRGPVTVHIATSVDPVEVQTMQITKSVNGTTQKNDKRSSDTMGTRHFVRFGLYVIKGSINVQLAEKTGFSENDAELLKECLRTLFINDAAAARPDGSMRVEKMFWWKHNNKIGQYSSATVHNCVHVALKDPTVTPLSFDDYNVEREELEGLSCEELEGL